MPGRIFVNYRRDDSAANALSVAQYLERTFGARNVFLDIDRMRAGQNFPAVLEEKLAGCKVMLAVIGPSWLTLKDDKGRRRIDDPADWVRLEITRALARGVTVIPVLVGGASLPKKSDLPAELQPLVERHAAVITTNGFRNEMAGLERDIRSLDAPRPWGRIGAAATLAAVTVALAGWFALNKLPMPDIPKTVEPAKQEARTADAPAPQDTAMPVLQPPANVPAKPDPALKVSPGSGQSFRDCPDVCPEMVVVPAGSFTMGSPSGEERWSGYKGQEEPQHDITIAKPFAVGRFAVTFEEWDACIADGGCKTKPSDQGWGRDKWPVINISWMDVTNEYLPWLSRRTGKTYRLLSEAEREYVTRAGTSPAFWWGPSVSTSQANYDGNYTYAGGAKGEFRGKPIPVDIFEPNPWGLYQVHGNVYEWTKDCAHNNYKGAPADGSAWTTACNDITRRVVRGGSFSSAPQDLRSANRTMFVAAERHYIIGFRVARAIE